MKTLALALGLLAGIALSGQSSNVGTRQYEEQKRREDREAVLTIERQRLQIQRQELELMRRDPCLGRAR